MIDIRRPPETGDNVRFITLRDLMPFHGTGVVEAMTAHGVRIKLPEGGTVDVRMADVTAQVSEWDALRWLIDQLKLIAAQDQGAGGNTSEAEAWRGAQAIARRAVHAMEAVGPAPTHLKPKDPA